MAEQEHNGGEHHVEVQVVTTSGSFPATGTERVSTNQPVENILKKAVKELKIVDTTGWIATVNGTQIDPEKGYSDLGLSGTVSIDYGPPHGGGGRE